MFVTYTSNLLLLNDSWPPVISAATRSVTFDLDHQSVDQHAAGEPNGLSFRQRPHLSFRQTSLQVENIRIFVHINEISSMGS